MIWQKYNNNANHILKYMSNINDNDIEKNNNLTKNNKNSPENSYIDPLEKKFNISSSIEIQNLSKKHDYNKDKGPYNKEYICIGTSFDFKEKNIEDEKNDLYDFLPEIFTFKHEYITNNRKIKEEFIIQGNEIISNVNNEETIKEFFKKCSNYAIIL